MVAVRDDNQRSALSLVLLIGASLLGRTFILLNRVDPGFDQHNLLLMTMSTRGGNTGTGAGLAAMVRVGCQGVTAIPGVKASAATFSPPFADRMGLPFTSLSRSPAISGDGEWLAASPGYFRVLKISAHSTFELDWRRLDGAVLSGRNRMLDLQERD
jgi:hypothetical protein